jgi:hypothetical protein
MNVILKNIVYIYIIYFIYLGSEGDTGGPKIKVISRAKSPKVAPKPDRPVNSPVPQPKEAPSTDF